MGGRVMRSSLMLVGLTLVLLLPRSAHAESGWSLSLFAGPQFVQDQTTSGDNAFSLNYGTGMTAGLAAGWAVPILPLRVELEYAWRRADLDDLLVVDSTFAAVGTRGSTGEATVQTAMANVLMDLPLPWPLPLSVYFGGGLGYGLMEARDHTALDGTALLDGDGGAFAAQGIVGLEGKLRILPFGLGVEYRHIVLSDADLGTPFGQATTGFSAGEVLVRARWRF